MINVYTPGNRVRLLRSGTEYFPALEAAIDAAVREVWFETYIFADDIAGRRIAAALIRAAKRGVKVRLLVDAWGVRAYLSRALRREIVAGGVAFLRYRPELAIWQFRSHRLRRLHRKLVHVDGRIAFIGGINVIDDMNTPGSRPPRVDFAVSVEGPLLVDIAHNMRRVWALVQFVQLKQAQEPMFAARQRGRLVGDQVAKFVIRDNLRHRRDIERAYLAAIRVARHEIIICNSYFFPGVRFRRALIAAAHRGVGVTLLLQARVEYLLLHFAMRALYGQLLKHGIVIQEYHRSMMHAKVAVVDEEWATVGSSNIDPYSLLMAREANVVVRDRGFAGELRHELLAMIEAGSQRVHVERWEQRSRVYKGIVWVAYAMVRTLMGLVGYGGNEWFREDK